MSIVLAMDMPPDQYERWIKQTCCLDGICGYKFGMRAAISGRLRDSVCIARELAPGKRLIYDHQKAGRDVIHMAQGFAQEVAVAGLDSAILYPLPGMPDEAEGWVRACQGEGLDVIVGAWMSSPNFAMEEGGPYAREEILDVYGIAARTGVRAFGVPANKSEAMGLIASTVKRHVKDPLFYAIGIGPQGGTLANAEHALEGKALAIVGRDVYLSDDVAGAVERILTSSKRVS